MSGESKDAGATAVTAEEESQSASHEPARTPSFLRSSALSFLRQACTSLLSRDWPLGSDTSLTNLLSSEARSSVLILLTQIISAYLKRRGDEVVDLDGVADANPAMALQTALLSLEDAMGVELGYVQVHKIAGEGHKQEFINLCHILETIFTSGEVQKQPEASLQGGLMNPKSTDSASKQPLRSALKKSASSTTTFQTFSKSGINRMNPFHSQKEAIYGFKSSPIRAFSPRDPFTEREAQRRREREDENYFQSRYSNRAEGEAEDEGGYRSDEDYRFLRNRSDLPLHKLTRGQMDTARELSFERSPSANVRPSSAPGKRGEKSPARAAIDNATSVSDEHLLSTIEYLERFVDRARYKANLQSGWESKLHRMGGAEAVGRQSAHEDTDVDYAMARRNLSPDAKGPSNGYASPTVSSDPLGAISSPPNYYSRPNPFTHPNEEEELARLELELAALKRQARSDQLSADTAVDLALENMRDRADIENSISLLKDYTQGRIPEFETRQERMAREMASRLFGTEPPHSRSYRIPSNHPHKTGKNHTPSTCVYCKRELDWQAWNNDIKNLLDESFPNRQPTWRTPSERLYSPPKGASGPSSTGHSRLRPLGSKMLEQSKNLTRVTTDFHEHFLGQMSAAQRRRAAGQLDSLWTIIANTDRDKKAQFHRIRNEIEEEVLRRSVHMRLLEERAIERALTKTMVDKQQEREVQKLLQDQARHTAHLLELKRQSLQNYTRDQLDLLAERHRIEAATNKLRLQNDRHSLREMQKHLKDVQEDLKQKKLNEIKHAEEKFAFRLSELKRPNYSEKGIDDLRFWNSGRSAPLSAARS